MKDHYCNINIGVLGHVDCGKTTLCKSLTEVASTASLDNNPQSKERGITIDLGFSSFTIHNQQQALYNNKDNRDDNDNNPIIASLPKSFVDNGYDYGIQICLVDCPGHASLIKTIIGGAQIIDICLLVIDITKGIQPQTAECIVIADILAPQLMIVLNKIDLISSPDIRYNKIKIMEKKLRKTFENSRFTSSLPIIAVSANNRNDTYNKVVNMLINNIKLPKRLLLSTTTGNGRDNIDYNNKSSSSANNNNHFTFSFDHCFSIKGVGTIFAGTVINGIVKVGDKVIILDSSTGSSIAAAANSSLSSSNSGSGGGSGGGVIKSIQIFKENVKLATPGDRCALCIPGINANKLERGMIICNNNNNQYYYPVRSMLAVVDKIKYFKDDIKSKSRLHITCGYATAMATVYFIKMNKKKDGNNDNKDNHRHNNNMHNTTTMTSSSSGAGASGASGATTTLGGGVLVAGNNNIQNIANNIIKEDYSIIHKHDFIYKDKLLLPNEIQDDNDEGNCCCCYEDEDDSDDDYVNNYYAIIEFDKPILASPGNVFIASRLDKEYNNNKSSSCRLAFYGVVCKTYKNIDSCRNDINVIKWKLKRGFIERRIINSNDDDELNTSVYIINNMFKKETDLKPFIGLKVVHNISGINGIIDSSFGKSGKIKCIFNTSKLPYINFDNKGNIINDDNNNKSPLMVSLLFKKRVLKANKDNNKSNTIIIQ